MVVCKRPSLMYQRNGALRNPRKIAEALRECIPVLSEVHGQSKLFFEYAEQLFDPLKVLWNVDSRRLASVKLSREPTGDIASLLTWSSYSPVNCELARAMTNAQTGISGKFRNLGEPGSCSVPGQAQAPGLPYSHTGTDAKGHCSH